MKSYTLTSLAAATLLLVGCGGGSSSSTSPSAQTGTTGTTIQVVRGPILGAVVRDDNGTGAVATSDGNGSYTFANTIKYPVVVTGGVIDMDRDGKVGVGDVKNDMNLTCDSGSVVTVATTFASKPETKVLLNSVASSLGINTTDIETKTPLDSKEIEAISNILYKYSKDNNISTQTLTSIKTDIESEHERYVQEDSSHDSKTTEQELIQKLSDDNKIQKLQSATEVDDEVQRINNEYSAKYKEANTEYERENGDMEYGENEGSSDHSQGASCASCHSFVNGTITPREFEGNEGSEGGESGENQFTSGATIFTKLHAAGGSGVDGASNYKIRLRLENNTSVTYSSGRGTGNVNGTFNSTAMGTYTAEVLNASGVVTNKSVENSHDTTRLDCNSCHTAAGSSAAPGRIVSFDYYGTLTTVANVVTAAPTTTTTPTTPTTPTTTTPTTTKSFQNDVLPVLTNKCNACHGGSNVGTTFLNTSNTYTSVMQFVDTTTPTASKLLQKGSGQTGHGGGSLFSTTSASYTTLQTWISEGANNN